KYCDDNLILKKLGRCRSCFWLSLLLWLGCAVLWWGLYHYEAEYVQQVAALVGAVFGGGLFVGHLVFGVVYRLTGQDGIFSPAEPEQ
ncbi:MAG: DUF3624 domain-containing protein, partial [Cellvibrionaceae bacterium]|nr:DUF3624 domain-containing protein [Cellvibrionaceae bacterium]